jgi:hypothetical protein
MGYSPPVQPIKLTPAVGGWLHADWGVDAAWVRFGKDDQDRLTRITEIHIANPTPETLRRVPLNRIHSAATMRGAGLIQVMLAVGVETEPPPEMLSERPTSGHTLEKRFRLKWKPRQPLDDDFLANVAHAYQSAVAFGLNPRKSIVEDTGAADATVAGWIVQARRSGHLPKAQPGKVSA